ncbi:hypothetical protein [Methanolobus sp. WCC5]|uniref:hypothetical protein n=1 Tax=Methanolobus sp. WCC5 TaxID=3125785 RepID=UPI0032556392
MKVKQSSEFPKTMGNTITYLTLFLILSACLILLQIPAQAFQDNTSDINVSSQDNSSSVISAISEYSHLIEIHFHDNDLLIVSESIVYLMDVTAEDEELVLWVPEAAQITHLQVTDMAGTADVRSLDHERNGSLVYFSSHGISGSNGMPQLYGIRYAIQDSGEGTVYRKVLREQGTFGYPTSRLIIIVAHDEDKVPVIISGEDLLIEADETISETDQTSYVWYSPQFDQLSITLEERDKGLEAEQGYAGIIAGAILFIIVIAVLYNRYRRNDSTDPYMPGELEDLYDAELAVIARIEGDWKKDKLSKEEYDSLHKKHTESAAGIKKRIEKLKRS